MPAALSALTIAIAAIVTRVPKLSTSKESDIVCDSALLHAAIFTRQYPVLACGATRKVFLGTCFDPNHSKHVPKKTCTHVRSASQGVCSSEQEL